MAVELRRHGGQTLPGLMEDISISGARIRIARGLPPLSRLEVVIDGQSVAAWVTRHDGDGIGVEWLEFGPRVVRTTLRMARNTAPRQPIGRLPMVCGAPIRLDLVA